MRGLQRFGALRRLFDPGGNGGAAAAAGTSLTINFLDRQEAASTLPQSEGSNDASIVAVAGADFAIFAPGTTLRWKLIFGGYNDVPGGSDPATPPEAAMFINCTDPMKLAGGAQLGANIALPETVLTKKTATGTIVAPAGDGFIHFVLFGGQTLDDDPAPYHTRARGVGLQFTVEP